MLTAASVSAQPDVTGSKDHPMFTRMPGYYITSYEDGSFDQFAFAPGRLSAAGFGQSKPIADKTTEAGRTPNRRVELVKK